jgi:hypothetical protein
VFMDVVGAGLTAAVTIPSSGINLDFLLTKI